MVPSPQLDPRLGRTELAYSDRSALVTALLLLGAVFAGAGILISGITTAVLLDSHTGKRDRNDAFGMCIFGLCMFVPGLISMIWALRERSGKPSWYLCEHGMVKVSSRGMSRLTFWNEAKNVTVVHVQRYGQTVNLLLDVNGRRCHVPDLQIARKAQELWARDNPAAAAATRGS